MLTDAKIDKLQAKEKPYKDTDSNNLFLYITPSGSKIWRYRYRIKKFVDGKYFLVEDIISLGIYPSITTKTTRELHDKVREQVKSGINPTLL